MTENIAQTKIFQLFTSKNNIKIYLVGGSVRELLLSSLDRSAKTLSDAKISVNSSILANDLDFAVECHPEETKRILEEANYKTYDIGKAYGTISVIIDNIKCELTTFRKDVSYTRDNRHPQVEWGKTIEDDLARRDFRCNAIALDSNNNLIDPFQGVDDLKNKIIDTPIESEKSFSDDPLRLLRAIRFKAKLGFQYSERVKEALYKCAPRLLSLSRERILEEMNKILMIDSVCSALEDLFEYRLINHFIPELVALKSIEQNSEYHHKNALLHTLNVVQNSAKDLTLRWAALFHDVAKAATFSSDNGEIHFLNHDEIGARMAYSIMHRMGFSKQMIKDVTYLVKLHMRANTYTKEWSDSSIRRFIRDTGEYCDMLLQLSEADITSHNPISIKRHLECLSDLKHRIEEQRNFKESPQCPVSGLAVMAYFDLPPCKKVGEIKDLILNAIILGELKIDDSEEVMLEYAKKKITI